MSENEKCVSVSVDLKITDRVSVPRIFVYYESPFDDEEYTNGIKYAVINAAKNAGTEADNVVEKMNIDNIENENIKRHLSIAYAQDSDRYAKLEELLQQIGNIYTYGGYSIKNVNICMQPILETVHINMYIKTE